jgi:small GTP-binding protein
MNNTTFKLILLGKSAAGKTSIISNYLYGAQTRSVYSTIGASYISYKNTINGSNYQINVWDTAGQERYRSLVALYYRNTDCAVFVFDVNDYMVSDIESYIKDFREKTNNPGILYYLVGNKIDLVLNKPNPEKYLETVKKSVEQLVETYSMNFFLVSAYTSDGIKELFGDIHQSIYKLEHPYEHQDSGSLKLEEQDKNSSYMTNCCYYQYPKLL